MILKAALARIDYDELGLEVPCTGLEQGVDWGKVRPSNLGAQLENEPMTSRSLPYIWDYDISEEQFQQLLAGSSTIGRLDQRWAAVRLLEHAPYAEIVRLLGFRHLVEGWPKWRKYIRSRSRRRGFDFLVEWLPKHHPELL